MRHGGPGAGCWACGLGLVDESLERSGRDDRGIGGGPPTFEGVELVVVLLTPLVAFGCSALFVEYESADLAGLGGGLSFETFRSRPASPGLVGLLGGSAGIAGGGVTSTVETLGDDFVAVKDVFLLSTSL